LAPVALKQPPEFIVIDPLSNYSITDKDTEKYLDNKERLFEINDEGEVARPIVAAQPLLY